MTKNTDNIFCLIGEFLNNLRTEEWAIKDDSDELIVLDKAKGRIATMLSRYYLVIEKKDR